MSRDRKGKRTIFLWGFAGWALVLGVIGIWRGTVLWQERALLAELEGTFSPGGLTLMVGSFVLCGTGTVVSAIGLWFRQDWARISARICIPLHAVAFQIYSWSFVRSGLMLERRWVAAVSSAAAVLIGVAVLTWKRTRTQLGLE